VQKQTQMITRTKTEERAISAIAFGERDDIRNVLFCFSKTDVAPIIYTLAEQCRAIFIQFT
jgi:hypothetical protein